ncbi:MAG: hypothetical protein ACI9FJ_003301 [Alteromonadaceae bacterium]|jgi:hypothetical protein
MSLEPKLPLVLITVKYNPALADVGSGMLFSDRQIQGGICRATRMYLCVSENNILVPAAPTLGLVLNPVHVNRHTVYNTHSSTTYQGYFSLIR